MYNYAFQYWIPQWKALGVIGLYIGLGVVRIFDGVGVN